MSNFVFPELQQLANRLRERVPYSAPAAKPLLVYGYVRTPEREPSYADACGDLLRWWAEVKGWQLGVVFRDLGVGSSQRLRPGFTGLTDVLRLPEAALAVIVEKRHLSRKPEGVKQLTAAIRRTGSSLRVLADELAEVPA